MTVHPDWLTRASRGVRMRPGGGSVSPHLQVPDEVRQTQAQKCERRGLVYLPGIVSESNGCPEISVHHARACVEFGLLHSHLYHHDAVTPSSRASAPVRTLGADARMTRARLDHFMTDTAARTEVGTSNNECRC